MRCVDKRRRHSPLSETITVDSNTANRERLFFSRCHPRPAHVMCWTVILVYCLSGLLGNDIKVMAAIRGQQLRPGEATVTHSCNHVRAPPSELSDPDVMRSDGVNVSFYQKYTEAYGLPILGTLKVSDDALQRACYTVRFLFAGHSAIRAIFYKLGGRFAIMSKTEVTLDFPEFSSMNARWNSRARGLGGTWWRPITTGAEENLLCYGRGNDRYHSEDIFLHEAAHAVDRVAAWVVLPGFRQALNTAFSRAKLAGLWNNTYAATNALEYWAEGVQSYFNVNHRGPRGGNGIHNNIDTRGELKDYDPTLFQLIQQVFPCNNTYLKRCQSTREMENAQVLQMDCNTDENSDQNRFLASLRVKDARCRDKRPVDCLYWALDGECDKNPTYMTGNCRASCKVCTPSTSTSPPPTSTTTTTTSDCGDSSTHCAWWASVGECDNNPAYMLDNCRLSCRQCTPPAPHSPLP